MAVSRVRYTKGFLLDLKERLEFIQEAYELLKMKRDELMEDLRERLERLKGLRELVEKEVEEVWRELALLHATHGTEELETYSSYLGEEIYVEAVSKSILGVVIPSIKGLHIPDLKDRYPPQIIPLTEKLSSMMKNLIKLAELEASVEAIAEDLRKTNIRVNALEKVVIPSYRSLIKEIQGILDDEELEEFIRMKLVKEILTRRRSI